MQEEACFRVQDEGFVVDAPLSGLRGVAARWSDFPWTREVCSEDFESVWDVGLQTYDYAHVDQLDED
jgi:hypothetical protein